LFLPQTANAFFCLMLGSGNKNYGRSAPYSPNRYPPAAYRLPPITPYRPAMQKRRIAPPRPKPQALQWRPVNYRSGSL